MVAAPVTKAEVAAALANVPTLEARPTFKKINLMETAIVDAVDCITSNQSEDHGYRGMVVSAQRVACQGGGAGGRRQMPAVCHRFGAK